MKMLVIIGATGVPLSEIYNPSNYPIARYEKNSAEARQLSAREGDIFFVERLTGNQFKVIRRGRYPLSQNDYAVLTAPPGAGGSGTAAGPVIPIGQPAESYNVGLPIGSMGGINWLVWVAAAYLIYETAT